MLCRCIKVPAQNGFVEPSRPFTSETGAMKLKVSGIIWALADYSERTVILAEYGILSQESLSLPEERFGSHLVRWQEI